MSPPSRPHRLIVTRPWEDGAAIAARLEERGIEPVLEPLLRISFKDGPRPRTSGVQALLATSANGVRAWVHRRGPTDLPVFAIGDATEREARRLGFATVTSAGGDVADLARLVTERVRPDGGALVHAAGSKVAGDLSGHLKKAGFTYRRAVLYAAQPATAFTDATARLLGDGAVDGVLLFSPRTAATFVTLVRAAGLVAACKGLTAYCLSSPVAAEIASLGWGRVRIATQPDQDSLLALVDDRPEAQKDSGNDSAGTRAMAETGKESETDAAPEATPPDIGESPTAAPRRAGGVGFGVFLGTVISVSLIIGAAAAAWPWLGPRLAALIPTTAQEPAQETAPEPATDPRVSVMEERLVTLRADVDGALAAAREVEDLKIQRQRLAQEVKSLLARLANLEGSLGEVARSAAAGANVGGDTEAALTAHEQRLAQLESMGAATDGLRDRLEEIENRSRDASKRQAVIDDLEARNVSLAAKVAALGDRLKSLEDSGRVSLSSVETVRAVSTALLSLRQALREAGPYASQLEALSAAAERDPAIQSAVEVMLPHAETGLPTLANLRDRFDSLARDAIVADRTSGGDGWLDQTIDRIQGLVTVRRTGGFDPADPDVAVSRAEGALRLGDLAAAVKALKNLEGAAAQTLAPWLKDARARVAAERALAGLDVHLAALFAPPKAD